jgi:DNA-binding transcriptional ArsR family regulator
MPKKAKSRARLTPRRKQMIRELGVRPMTVSELARALKMDKASAHRSIEGLRTAHLVRRPNTSRKWIYYRLTPKGRHAAASLGFRRPRPPKPPAETGEVSGIAFIDLPLSIPLEGVPTGPSMHLPDAMSLW